jgi:hypothetical protein
LPKEQRDALEHADELFGFMNQSHISAKNIAPGTAVALLLQKRETALTQGSLRPSRNDFTGDRLRG